MNQIFGDIQVNGGVRLDANIFLTGDVRPLHPDTRSTAGTYTLDSFAVGVYRSAEYLVQVSQGNNFSSQRIQILHDGVNALLNAYGKIETPSAVVGVEFEVSIVSGVVVLVYTQPALTTTVKALGTCLKI